MEGVNYNRWRRGYGARDKEELINAIVKLHKEGYSQVDIAKMLKVNRGTISRWNKELGFITSRSSGEAGKMKSRMYEYNEDYFANIQTSNQAYLIGYILGDGTLVDRKKSKRLVLSLAEEDKQLLYDIAKEFNMTEVVKFRKTNAKNEQNKFSLLISSTKLCNDLISLGVTPKKTGNEKWIDFNDEKLQWAFLRGFFDADGHIRVYQRNGWLKSRVGFTGTKEMLESILQFLRSYGIGRNVNSIHKKQGCYDLYISSVKEAQIMFGHLYKYGGIKLNRKYKKISSLMI
ncbi:intein/homing endonuclease [Bacillus fengqiuensis]|nr:intein/homing endonuclease [Bacillus fengqiuensis]